MLLAGGVGAAGLAGGAGLYLGVWYGRRKERWVKRAPPRPEPLSPDVHWALDSAGVLSVWVPKSEMGQGVLTSLPLLVAEELDVDWENVRPVRAQANQNFGFMLTATSDSVRRLWSELRRAGALGRAMLIGAAAESWGVPPETCTTEPGFVVHPPSGRRQAYGVLAAAAGRRPLPDDAPSKDPSEFRLIGRSPPRLDIPDKLDGSAEFGADVRVPGLAFAVVRQAPMGTDLNGFSANAAERVPGVRSVHSLSGAVAVVADHSWAAFQGAEALTLEHTDPRLPDETQVRERLAQALDAPGLEAAGTTATEPAAGGKTVRSELFLPYLPHLNMEPANATAWVEPERCRIWAPTQAPRAVHHWARDFLGLPEAQIEVQPTLLGTGFGRRAAIDEVKHAVELSRKLGGPVQVQWSRTEDLQHDHYRPASLHRLEATLNDDGLPATWRHRIANPSILGLQPGTTEVDEVAVEGAVDLPYAVADWKVTWHVPDGLPLQVGFWRSVGHSYNAFAVETFVDELAETAGVDPAEYRARLLKGRHADVLERLVDAAGWTRPSVEGEARGMAIHASFGSVVGQVVEVCRDPAARGGFRINRVVAAVDCGFAVHPDGIRAQIEGGVAFALSAALLGRLDVTEGRIRNTNFHDAPVLLFPDMPAVEVHVLDRPDEPPGGVGEVAVPPLAPALCNALARLDGERRRRLPLFG